jgi:hypothetical protein
MTLVLAWDSQKCGGVQTVCKKVCKIMIEDPDTH